MGITNRPGVIFAALLAWLSVGVVWSAEELATVSVANVELPQVYRLDGVAEAVNRSTVSAQTSGRVVEVNFDVDDYVRAGDVIVRLEDSQQRASVTREVERYSVWPGQACSYKLGMIRINALRKEAEEALGDKFDIREFHDQVLLTGSMPMPVLEKKIRAWIESKRAA